MPAVAGMVVLPWIGYGLTGMDQGTKSRTTSASTAAPAATWDGSAHSCSTWLSPPRQGMETMAAVQADRATGRYIDPAKVRSLDHHGPHFDVKGPLNIGRAPQGHPVVLQAGGSAAGVASGPAVRPLRHQHGALRPGWPGA